MNDEFRRNSGTWSIFSDHITLGLGRPVHKWLCLYLVTYFFSFVSRILALGGSPLREGDGGIRHFLGPIFRTFCPL